MQKVEFIEETPNRILVQDIEKTCQIRCPRAVAIALYQEWESVGSEVIWHGSEMLEVAA